MVKITFLGAGSTVFLNNVLGDCMCVAGLHDAHYALYDIDPARLEESKILMDGLNSTINQDRARITVHLGVAERRAALDGADYVINAVQVGGYDPCTITDFEVPKKYGLRQTIADTLGIGGIFRGLRTIPVMMDFTRDMEAVCPEAWLLNYSNPMSILTGSMLQRTAVKTVGLCHSVQVCARELMGAADLNIADFPDVRTTIAGINHMAWLLDIHEGDTDLYPMLREKAFLKLAAARKPGGEKYKDMVRLHMMQHFGYYITESSEHLSEYLPYWIKSGYPELIDEFNIPLDEYPRRCRKQAERWGEQKRRLFSPGGYAHTRSIEYASHIIDAIETGVPYEFGGNVLNQGFISNLPNHAVVEVTCRADGAGIQGLEVGALPIQLAALNQNHINVHQLVIEAAQEQSRDKVYYAACLDPHLSAELPLDQIRALVDDLFEAHKDWLPEYN